MLLRSILSRCTAILLLVFSLANGGFARAQAQLRAVAGLALPPYVIRDGEDGIEVDILRQALALSGYTVRLDFVPFARVPVSLKNREADCALTINESSGITGVFYSQSHVKYQNVAIALRSRGYRIRGTEDLKPYRVIAFQGALNYLGQAFRAMAEGKATGYSEMANQDTQIKMLYSERTDIIVMDINIFHYLRRSIRDVDISPEVAIFEIFKPTYYKVAFTDPEPCRRFNEGLARLRSSGRYEAIFRRYLR